MFSSPPSPQVPSSTGVINPASAVLPATNPTADPNKPLFPSAAPQVTDHALYTLTVP